MFPIQPDNSHLSAEQRYFIKYQLSHEISPQEIIDKWEMEYHHRAPPSIQTIYSINRQILDGEDVAPKQPGPRNRRILHQKKLEEIEEWIEEDPFITNEQLGLCTDLPTSTVHLGLKVLEMKKYHAVKVHKLKKSEMEARVSFCNSFLRWNEQYQLRVWWSDESPFRIDELIKHHQTTYYAVENEHRKVEKIKKEKMVNVWAAIRGDGKVIFKILEGRQTAVKYSQRLLNVYDEMDQETSFFMQDGASVHTGKHAVDWLNEYWGNRWIGLKSKRLTWPPKSHDLTPMDFSFWNYVKHRVAQHQPESRQELIDSTTAVMNDIPSKVIINMCTAVKERCRRCIMKQGGRFEDDVEE